MTACEPSAVEVEALESATARLAQAAGCEPEEARTVVESALVAFALRPWRKVQP